MEIPDEMIPSYVHASHKILFPAFVKECSHQGVNIDPEDMKPWWEFYLHGATVMYLLVQADKITVEKQNHGPKDN